MARLLNGSSQYLSGNDPLTALPMTMACWFQTDNIAATPQELLWIGDAGASNRYWRMYLVVSTTLRLAAGSRTGVTGERQALGGTAITSNGCWHHGAARFIINGTFINDDNDDISVFLDGVRDGTNASTGTPTNINALYAGRLGSSAANFLDGRIAEIGVWNKALDNNEIAALAAGMQPNRVRPSALVAYIPLLVNDRDQRGVYDLTAADTPTFADHAPVFGLSGAIGDVPVAAPAVLTRNQVVWI